MTSRIAVVRRSPSFSSVRRRSPSVKMPTMRSPSIHDRGHAHALRGTSPACASDSDAVSGNARNGLAGAHHVAHMGEQAPAEAAAGMRAGEIVLRRIRAPPAAPPPAHRPARAPRWCWRWARGRAGRLPRSTAGVEMDVGLARQGRVRIAGHRDQLGALALDQRHDRQQFGALAGIGQRDHDVVARDHAEIAVAGFGGMDEEGRGAGAGQRRGDLAGDVARLADAADHDAAAAAEHDLDGPHETRRRGARDRSGDRAAPRSRALVAPMRDLPAATDAQSVVFPGAVMAHEV